MVLNLHGEVPSTLRQGITDLNAEEEFLPTLKMLNQRFPKLRIVLEHCTTEAALNAVRECTESVAGMSTSCVDGNGANSDDGSYDYRAPSLPHCAEHGKSACLL